MGCAIKRIIQLTNAIAYQPVKVINGDERDITLECRYSWSSDGVCWTTWADYGNYTKITPNLDTDVYLRILIADTLKYVYLSDVITTCYSICLDNTNPFLESFCANANLFQPYNNLDCALLLQQQLADSIVCMFGIPVYYFSANPRAESMDYTFKEFTMHDVVAVKQLRLMIEDGQMPSSNPKLNDFDFDWDVDWETEISKTQFAKAFGDKAYPNANDFLYIPMMKRMWEVSAAYDEKKEGLLWRPTTWKLQLVKYNDNKNVITNNFDDLIDNWVSHTYEEAFGEMERNEQERAAGASPLSAPAFAATNLYNIFMEDAVRKQYTKDDIIISDKIYCHHNNIVCRNIYDFKNDNGCVIYQHGICGDSGTVMFVVETGDVPTKTLDKTIMQFGSIEIMLAYMRDEKRYIIGSHDLYTEIDPFSTYMVIYKWNRSTFTAELAVYKHSHDTSKPAYLLRPESYFFDFENPICEKVGPYNRDYVIDVPQQCSIHAYPVMVSNVKLYNKALGHDEAIKECIKYTTNDDRCVINDLARPIFTGHGYAVR